MKNINFVILCIVFLSINIFGQGTPPAVSDNANISDNSLKMRSAELEKTKRDETVAAAAKFAPINKDIVARFPQIKEDFEGLQMAQAAIITAYTTGKKIDYSLIETSANEILKKAKRLDSNLFSPQTEIIEDDPAKKDEKKQKTIRDLIVELDNTIGSFVSSKIFGNIKIIEPEVAIKTRTDLIKIEKLSIELANDSAKL
ncbi:MAG: hypothetical protein AAB336_06730, partial [Acidobacteriota bacterium]